MVGLSALLATAQGDTVDMSITEKTTELCRLCPSSKIYVHKYTIIP